MAEENNSTSAPLAFGSCRRRKRLVLWAIALVVLGWFAYGKLSPPSPDLVLYNALLRQTENHPGKTISIKIKNIYPGSWIKVCEFGTYTNREEILKLSGIDIKQTRAINWAGSETSGTFLFVYPDGTIIAQEIKDGYFSVHGNVDVPCGSKESIILLRHNPEYKHGESSKYFPLFIASPEE